MLKRFFILICLYSSAYISYGLFTGYKPIKPKILNPVGPKLTGVPPISQKSINIAIKTFKIKIPWNAFYPILDVRIPHNIKGLALTNAALGCCYVTIGKSAFTSWGSLGATLAHEIEVHCNQNYVQAMWDEIRGCSAVVRIEREAYTYVLLSHKRFYLTPKEYRDIKFVMEYYYPIRKVKCE